MGRVYNALLQVALTGRLHFTLLTCGATLDTTWRHCPHHHCKVAFVTVVLVVVIVIVVVVVIVVVRVFIVTVIIFVTNCNS